MLLLYNNLCKLSFIGHPLLWDHFNTQLYISGNLLASFKALYGAGTVYFWTVPLALERFHCICTTLNTTYIIFSNLGVWICFS